MKTVAVLGTFDTAAENSEVAARHLEAAGHRVIRVGRDEPLPAKLRKIAGGQIVYGSGFGFAAKLWAVARLLGKRTVNHWVGTDVLMALEDARMRTMAHSAMRFIQTHLTVAPWLAEELAQLGVKAKIAALTTPVRYTVRAEPGQPGVLAYLPDNRADFYGAAIVRELADQLPDLPFGIVAGTTANQPRLPNVTYYGWVDDLRPLYERYPILLRVARHDGLPKMVLEALAYGNQVIFEYPFKGCYHARDEAEALAALKDILAAGCPVNERGAAFVQQHYSPEQLARELVTLIGYS